MSALRVLMLGWEFPPLVNGGLGIACHGLATSLSQLVDLHVVLPKADTTTLYDGYRVSSLDQTGPDQSTFSRSHTDTKRRFASIDHVTHPGISPYFCNESQKSTQTTESSDHKTWEENGVSHAHKGFRINSLYGNDVGEKVYQFSQVLKVEGLKYDFDIIHAHDWMTYQAGLELKRVTGKPLVVHLHASQYDRAGADAKGWIYEIERNGMQGADLVIPVSNYTGEIVRDHYHVNEDKIKTVHNGAEAVNVFKSKKKFPEKLVLFLGRLTAQKGPEFFLEIASLVMAENPNVRFVMAGTGEKMRHLIEAGAFKGLGGKFHFTGFLNKDKVNELLSMTDVYCMPSVSEPFGLSALEAAQFGIPAVISKQSGVSEILKGSLKADFWDTELMAKHINTLLTNEEVREEVVKNALDDISQATWDKAAEKIVSLYQELV